MNKQTKKEVYYDKIPLLQKPGASKLKEQISKGLGAIVIIVLGIVLYFAFLRLDDIMNVISMILNILMPIIYGVAFAYLLNPLTMKIDNFVYEILSTHFKWKKEKGRFTPKKISRTIGVIVSIALLLTIVFVLIYLIIPELVTSVENLIVTLPSQLSAWVVSIEDMRIANSEIFYWIEYAYVEVVAFLQSWVQTELMSQVNSWMSNITFGIIAFVGWFFDFVMGIIIAAYLLLSKEKFLYQAKKIIYALLPVRKANISLHIMKKSNEIFGGFIIGKILDSALMGIITFVAMMIMDMPYGLLLSVIVGVTNVVPYFGPFIGAIPCAILVLLQSPIQGIYFIIYIIILQQVDGNIIGPKILGDSTGLSIFWVIFAILVGSGLFGFVGMLIGVPSFAVIYYIVKLFLDQRLEAKNLPIHSSYYDTNSYVDTQTGLYVASKEVKRMKEEEAQEENEETKN